MIEANAQPLYYDLLAVRSAIREALAGNDGDLMAAVIKRADEIIARLRERQAVAWCN